MSLNHGYFCAIAHISSSIPLTIDGSDLIVGSQAEFDKLLEDKTEELVQEKVTITEE